MKREDMNMLNETLGKILLLQQVASEGETLVNNVNTALTRVKILKTHEYGDEFGILLVSNIEVNLAKKLLKSAIKENLKLEGKSSLDDIKNAIKTLLTDVGNDIANEIVNNIGIDLLM